MYCWISWSMHVKPHQHCFIAVFFKFTRLQHATIFNFKCKLYYYGCCYGNLLCHKIDNKCSPMIGQFFVAMIAASSKKEWLYWPIIIFVFDWIFITCSFRLRTTRSINFLCASLHFLFVGKICHSYNKCYSHVMKSIQLSNLVYLNCPFRPWECFASGVHVTLF